MSEFLYPLDTTGSALSNRVRGEFQTLSPPTQSDNFHFIIPKSGPYYRDTLKIRHVSSNRLLIRGVDWEAGHYFHSASYETEGVKGGIYQSILFLDRSLSGQIHLEEYFVLGGEWSLDENKILEILSNRLWDPRTITYERVSGKPEVFPPIEHMHPAGDLTGMREQVEATYQVSAAIREQTEELPGKLETYLYKYYDVDDVDEIILGLSEQMITGIAGPQILTLLQEMVTGEMGNYSTTEEMIAIIDGVIVQLEALYSNDQIDDILLLKADKNYVDLKLVDKVDLVELNAIIQNLVTVIRLDAEIETLRDDINDLVNSLQLMIVGLNNSKLNISTFEQEMENVVREDSLRKVESESLLRDEHTDLMVEYIKTDISNINDKFPEYIRLSELESLLPNVKMDTRTLLPATVTSIYTAINGEGVLDTIKFNHIHASIDSVNMENDGSIGSITFIIHGDNNLWISTDGDGNRDVEIDEEKTFTLNLQGYDSKTLAGMILYLKIIDEIDENGDIVRDHIVDFSIVSESDLLLDFDMTIDGNVERTTTNFDTLAMGKILFLDSGPKWIPFENSSKQTEYFASTIELNEAEALMGGTSIIKLNDANGHRRVGTLGSIVVTDGLNNIIPVSNFKYLHRDMIVHEVHVTLPAIDLSHYEEEDRTVTISVSAQTNTII